MIRLLAVVLVCLILTAKLPAAEENPPRPLLVANYYVWYHDDSHPDHAWAGWTRQECKANERSLARQRPGEPPPSSALRPLLGLYDSRDPAVADWHIQLAQAAGINAFLVDWWGTHQGRDRNAELGIIAAANKRNFPFAILDERAQFHRELDDYGDWVIAAMKKYFPLKNYLRIDDKPVWYLYQVAASPGLTPDDFIHLRSRVEAEVGPVYWIVDKIEHAPEAARAGRPDQEKRIPTAWRPVEGVDAFGFYSTFSNFRAHRYEQLVGRYRYLTNLAHQSGKAMLLPVHPGHDNSFFRDDFYIMPRRDGDTLRDFLRAVTDSGADIAMITSWNEWPESTVVEPTSTWHDPYCYLRILAEWQGREFQVPSLPVQ